MSNRIIVGSGAVWEEIVGYARAVRVGNIVEVAGTTAVDEQGNVVGRDDPAAQTRYILSKIERALQQAGAQLSDVVRTRMFVTNIEQWQAIGQAHGEYFRQIKPAASMVQVVALIQPDLLVEIEATAVIS